MNIFLMGKYQAYVWKGVNKWNKKTSGIIIAEDDVSAESESRRLNLAITSLKKRPVWLLPGKADRNVKTIDIVYTMRQLSTLINAGVPLMQSMEIMAMGSEKAKLRAMLLTIRDTISSGKTFSEALQPFPTYFTPLICGLIHAGEQSGTLDKMVLEVANYLEHNEHLKNKIKKASYYPATILTVMILIVIGILTFLVPRFEKIYASFNAKLPTFTLQVVRLSNFIRDDWWIILTTIIGLVFLYRTVSKNSAVFRYSRDALLLKLFIIGNLIQKVTIARVCATLSITLTAGIPLIDALSRIARVATNQLYRESIAHAREQVVQGESIATALRETQLYPPMVTQMIEIGEKSGSLDQMFNKIGQYYSEQVDTTVDGLTTLIEPLMIIIVGIIVAIFMFAMYLPIFNLGLSIK